MKLQLFSVGKFYNKLQKKPKDTDVFRNLLIYTISIKLKLKFLI